MVLGRDSLGRSLISRPGISNGEVMSLLSTVGIHGHPDNSLHPPHAHIKLALDVLHTASNTLETKYPVALFIVVGTNK